MKLFFACALVSIAGSSAFSPVRTFSSTHGGGCQKTSSSSSLHVPIGECGSGASPNTALRIATSPEDLNTGLVIPPRDERKHPEMMDEDIYRFNKLLIDTVYNVICFFYPVEGTKRDFARFYVLETVARIPYFGTCVYGVCNFFCFMFHVSRGVPFFLLTCSLQLIHSNLPHHCSLSERLAFEVS